MIGEYELRDWEERHWLPIFEKNIELLPSDGKEAWTLYKQDICPENVCHILRKLGYDEESCEENKGEIMMVFGHTDKDFILTLYISAFLFTWSISKEQI